MMRIYTVKCVNEDLSGGGRKALLEVEAKVVPGALTNNDTENGLTKKLWN